MAIYALYTGPWRGSGPRDGVIGIRPHGRVSFFRNYTPRKALREQGIEFIFDHRTGVMLIGHVFKVLSPHEYLVQSMGLPVDDQEIVGGHYFRELDRRWTNEDSGHYGLNWSPTRRSQYRAFREMLRSEHGIDIQHREWL